MPTDEYSSFGSGGALKLKGAKVSKKDKKKKKVKADLEKALSADGGKPSSSEADDSHDKREPPHDGEEEEGEPVAPVQKTEAERKFTEARRKKLLEMSDSAVARPELLKTHKQRVEELNTYLSKLSEHHDMPKIGPG